MMGEKKTKAFVLAACAVAAAGCYPDSALRDREETTGRLRAELRDARRRAARAEGRLAALREAVRSGRTPGAVGLIEDLRRSGFSLEKGAEPGTLRLRLAADLAGGGAGPEGGLGTLAASRLVRAATVLRERLPDHELSVEARDFGRAVAAVRILHEEAGVPGGHLRAVAGAGAGVALEVRPTRIETLHEVLAATGEF
jgi:hypothetical protein